MANIAFTATNESASRPQVWIRRYLFILAGLTLFLMALGSATRVMNAGLACPDWPLCYGAIIPRQQMNLQVFLEWFHRLVASSMGLLVIGFVAASLVWRRSLPGWLPWASLAAFALVVCQGILGGLTVTQLLRFDIVTAHLGTGLLFFSTLVAIACCLMPHQGMGSVGRLRWVSLAATLLIYGQSILGALVASRWALHQCLGGSKLCVVMNSHIAGVVPATLATLATVVIAWYTPALHPTLRKLANLAGGLVVLQVLIGIATFKLRLQVEPLTVMHQAVGASLLGTLVAFTVLSLRDAPAWSVLPQSPTNLTDGHSERSPQETGEQPA